MNTNLINLAVRPSKIISEFFQWWGTKNFQMIFFMLSRIPTFLELLIWQFSWQTLVAFYIDFFLSNFLWKIQIRFLCDKHDNLEL